MLSPIVFLIFSLLERAEDHLVANTEAMDNCHKASSDVGWRVRLEDGFLPVMVGEQMKQSLHVILFMCCNPRRRAEGCGSGDQTGV